MSVWWESRRLRREAGCPRVGRPWGPPPAICNRTSCNRTSTEHRAQRLWRAARSYRLETRRRRARSPNVYYTRACAASRSSSLARHPVTMFVCVSQYTHTIYMRTVSRNVPCAMDAPAMAPVVHVVFSSKKNARPAARAGRRGARRGREGRVRCGARRMRQMAYRYRTWRSRARRPNRTAFFFVENEVHTPSYQAALPI